MMTRILAKVYLWFLLALLYSPILIIMIFSFTEAKVLGNWTGFSTKLYSSLFSGGMHHSLMNAICNTFIIALLAASISTALGSVAAIGIYNLRSVGPTGKSRGPPGEITWAPRGNHVGTQGKSRGPHGEITSAPRGNHPPPFVTQYYCKLLLSISFLFLQFPKLLLHKKSHYVRGGFAAAETHCFSDY